MLGPLPQSQPVVEVIVGLKWRIGCQVVASFQDALAALAELLAIIYIDMHKGVGYVEDLISGEA